MNEDTSKAEVVEDTVVDTTPETTNAEPSDNQPEVEPEETPRKYADKYTSPDDLEKAYLEAQRKLTEQGTKLKQYEEPKYTPDQKEIADQIRSLGFMTQDEFEHKQAIQSQESKDNAEIAKLGIDEVQISILKRYATHPDNVAKSMTDLWSEIQGTAGGKVVSRKTTIKPQSGTRGAFTPLPNDVVAKLPQDKYDQYWKDYEAYKAS